MQTIRSARRDAFGDMPKMAKICLLCLLLAACGGGGSGGGAAGTVGGGATSRPSSHYALGGSISGLSSAGLVLVDGGASVAVPANALVFSFGAVLLAGDAYSVSVQTQPAGETCTVVGGAGTAGAADVTSPTVSCAAKPVGWTWVGGSNVIGAGGIYGTKGTASVGNVPGARGGANSWTDASGNLWLFGGASLVAAGFAGSGGSTVYLNDLWRYSPATGLWTWVSGFSQPNVAGYYGTPGVAAAANVPGTRFGAASWTDSSGAMWLFGGVGYDSTSQVSYLNDLWKFDPGTSTWTWVGGSNVKDASGTYGIKGVPAVGNMPGAREAATTWTDASGNLWLFGGEGFSAPGLAGNLNDLWKYSPTTGLWTWVSGSAGVYAVGVYGTQGVASPANAPGSRIGGTAWIDKAGKLWLFGGDGNLNDLWTFDPSTNMWTWLGGSNTVNATGVYGMQGVQAASNMPGPRLDGNSWTDGSGNLWLFGGTVTGSTGANTSLNDLWRYEPAAGTWTWVAGSNIAGANGIYGTLGMPGNGNAPGARAGATAWADSSGAFWLFGGYGDDSINSQGPLNDFWRYQP